MDDGRNDTTAVPPTLTVVRHSIPSTITDGSAVFTATRIIPGVQDSRRDNDDDNNNNNNNLDREAQRWKQG